MADRLLGGVAWTLLFCCWSAAAPGQVFVVGERSAMADIRADFTPTNLPLPGGRLDELGRRELVRTLEAEKGFAHRALPMGPGMKLVANGPVSPEAEAYKKMLYEKGISIAAGDRVVITAMQVKADRIVFDLNGGPYEKHRFLRHVEIGDTPLAVGAAEEVTGSRVTLVFPSGIPEITGPVVKALLMPIIDFRAKSSAEAYADTLPPRVKAAIDEHTVLVGMDRRMVLAAKGAPGNKVREHAADDPDGPRFEEWIYGAAEGQTPQPVEFVRFVNDRVVLVKIAAPGRAIEIHDKSEMGDDLPQVTRREIALGDGAEPASRPAPTLREPGEAAPPNASSRVQVPAPAAASKPTPVTPPPGEPGGGVPQR